MIFTLYHPTIRSIFEASIVTVSVNRADY